MAVGDMGDGDGFFGKQELDDGPFGGLKARTTELLQQYLVSADNQVNRGIARKVHTDATATIKNTSARNVTEYSEAIKRSAQLVKTLSLSANN